MTNCPLLNRQCEQNKCAWWIEIVEDDCYEGRCAVSQLATTINCEVKLHG
jgi:hypothetical protein